VTPPAPDERTIAANREAQRALYGDTLEARIGRVTQRYGVSQRRLAQVLGISAPMLSQLISARRVKMGNTLAYERLVLLENREDEATDAASGAQVLTQVAASDAVTTTRMRSRASSAVPSGSLAHELALAIGTDELRAAREALSATGGAPRLLALADEALRQDS
jgi:predicted transcriptional regulator